MSNKSLRFHSSMTGAQKADYRRRRRASAESILRVLGSAWFCRAQNKKTLAKKWAAIGPVNRHVCRMLGWARWGHGT